MRRNQGEHAPDHLGHLNRGGPRWARPGRVPPTSHGVERRHEDGFRRPSPRRWPRRPRQVQVESGHPEIGAWDLDGVAEGTEASRGRSTKARKHQDGRSPRAARRADAGVPWWGKTESITAGRFTFWKAAIGESTRPLARVDSRLAFALPDDRGAAGVRLTTLIIVRLHVERPGRWRGITPTHGGHLRGPVNPTASVTRKIMTQSRPREIPARSDRREQSRHDDRPPARLRTGSNPQHLCDEDRAPRTRRVAVPSMFHGRTPWEGTKLVTLFADPDPAVSHAPQCHRKRGPMSWRSRTPVSNRFTHVSGSAPRNFIRPSNHRRTGSVTKQVEAQSAAAMVHGVQS